MSITGSFALDKILISMAWKMDEFEGRPGESASVSGSDSAYHIAPADLQAKCVTVLAETIEQVRADMTVKPVIPELYNPPLPDTPAMGPSSFLLVAICPRDTPVNEDGRVERGGEDIRLYAIPFSVCWFAYYLPAPDEVVIDRLAQSASKRRQKDQCYTMLRHVADWLEVSLPVLRRAAEKAAADEQRRDGLGHLDSAADKMHQETERFMSAMCALAALGQEPLRQLDDEWTPAQPAMF